METPKGLGAETLGFEGPVSDARYFELAQPYLDKAEVGMFLNAKRYKKENVEHAAKAASHSFVLVLMQATQKNIQK